MTAIQLGSYLAYFVSGLFCMGVFMFIYERITPYRELELMRSGNVAAALSFGGALIGFTLTLASSAMHTMGWVQYLTWAVASGVLQLLAFWIASAVIRSVKEHIQNGNVAVGAGLFCVSIAVGMLNAACLS